MHGQPHIKEYCVLHVQSNTAMFLLSSTVRIQLRKTEGPPPETTTQLNGALLYKNCLAIKKSLVQISRKTLTDIE